MWVRRGVVQLLCYCWPLENRIRKTRDLPFVHSVVKFEVMSGGKCLVAGIFVSDRERLGKQERAR